MLDHQTRKNCLRKSIATVAMALDVVFHVHLYLSPFYSATVSNEDNHSINDSENTVTHDSSVNDTTCDYFTATDCGESLEASRSIGFSDLSQNNDESLASLASNGDLECSDSSANV